MNEARVDHIEQTLASLDRKFDGLSVQLHESTDRLGGRIDGQGARLDGKIDALEVTLTDRIDAQGERLDGRIDALTAEMRAGFSDVQAGFDDHRRYAEFLVHGVREDMSKRFNQVERRFDSVDERFDRVNDRFKGVDQRFDQMDSRFDRMDTRFDSMDERFDRLEQLIKER